MGRNKFTKEEWGTCIKVLNILKDDPLNNPDNQTLKTLISKIYKNARKSLRKENIEQSRAQVLASQLESVISQDALQNKTTYSSGHTQEIKRYKELPIPINCYCCNTSFSQLHFFYNRMCPNCAENNYSKRFNTIDIEGKNVILTGCRVKIGYATALKALRSGANVLATTRFPALALQQFKGEKDYKGWKSRLVIYGLDLRSLHAVNDFINFANNHFQSLDILINNAAQTIKYPNEYYQPLINNETYLLNEYSDNKNLISNKTPIVDSVKLLELGDSLISFSKIGLANL